ncbi:MAG: hypothetical protein KC729_12695, partial [Candidatus Eisenbacteria bacterium]|nr:hypothetical protein [Candidatus Eisenbacteria bacterium]
DWARRRIDGGTLEQAGIRRLVARELLDEHLSRRHDRARALWTLLVLSEWIEWWEETDRDGAESARASRPHATHSVPPLLS